MAIYHFEHKVHSRADSGNCNAVRSAAYRSASILVDEFGNKYNYAYKTECTFGEILAPKNAPEWVADRATLWRKVEEKELRGDAQLFREIEASLPNELTEEQQIALIRDFSINQLTALGMIVDYSIHSKPGNKHVHMSLTMRDITGAGFGNKNRDWNDKKLHNKLREEWANVVNRHLADAGINARIDHRTLKAQGSNAIPTVHEGCARNNQTTRVKKRKELNASIKILNSSKSIETEILADELHIEAIQSEIDRLESKSITPISNSNVETVVLPNTQAAYSDRYNFNMMVNLSKQNRLDGINYPAPNDIIRKANDALTTMAQYTRNCVINKVDHLVQALPTGCRDVRLPNGKIIYPSNIGALEQAIKAWDISGIDAKNIRESFWKSCSPDYYFRCMEKILLSSPDMPTNAHCSREVLNNLRLAGMSPRLLIKYINDDNNRRLSELRTPDNTIKAVDNYPEPLNVIKQVVDEPKPPQEQEILTKDKYLAMPINKYFNLFLDELKQHKLSMDDSDPITFFKKWKAGCAPKDYVLEINATTSKDGKKWSLSIELLDLFKAESKIENYYKLFQPSQKLRDEDINIHTEFWSQIKPDDYYNAVKHIFYERSLIMPFDSIPKKEILQGLNNRTPPDDFSNGLFSQFRSGYNIPPDMDGSATPYGQAFNLYDSLHPSEPKPPGSSSPNPWNTA